MSESVLTFLFGILVAIISALLISLFFAGSDFFINPPNYLATIQAIGTIAVAASVFVAYFLYKRTIIRHHEEDDFKSSEKFLGESIQLLERAYETFTGKYRKPEMPVQNRVEWLTTARMILRYKNMRGKIKEPVHKEIVDEHEEYWRHQFYVLLDDCKDEIDREWFEVSPKKHKGKNISEKSIAVIYEFIKWKGKDVLDVIDDKKLFASKIIYPDQCGVLSYLSSINDGQYWEKVQIIIEKQNARK